MNIETVGKLKWERREKRKVIKKVTLKTKNR